MRTYWPYMVYPSLLGMGTLFYIGFYSVTAHLFLSAGLAIFFMGCFIYSLEKINPLRPEWEPTFRNLMEDILFYTVGIQLLLPFILFWGGTYLVKQIGFPEGRIFSFWPKHLDFYWQILLMGIIGEFFFYWWHRLAHTVYSCWTIHSVHHFPTKLYSINTVRFHFLDKFVEFVLSIFIFYQVGVSTNIVVYYYIFFAATGLIQHCNYDVRLGLFDYLIASGETHRFHHDHVFKKSQCNYANNLVLWDIVFNTFKRKIDHSPDKVGIKKFSDQGIVFETLVPIKYFLEFCVNTAVSLKMKMVKFNYVSSLVRAARKPQETQEKLLLNLIRKNNKTVFGKEHYFEEINSIDDFKKKVSICDYENLRPYIERFLLGETKVLSDEDPHYFNKTSGTTGKPKYIPVTLEVQRNYLRNQSILINTIFTEDKSSFEGFIFSVIGSASEEILNGKWPAGSMSGKISSLTPYLIKKKYVIGEDLSEFEDLEKKNFYLGALALLVPEVTTYLSPNPSTLLKIIDTVNTKKHEILQLLENENDLILLPYQKNKERAISILNTNRPIDLNDLWPQLRSAVMWTGGSCAYLIPQIRKMLNAKTQLVELGYLSSEFYGTINVNTHKNIQVPTLENNYFEFIEKEKYDLGDRNTLQLHELKEGEEYYIIVTTPSGLYRYFINDILKVNGFFEKTPSLIFMQKGKGITSLMGEKLSEYQIVSFFFYNDELKEIIEFFICLADQEKQKYVLYVELRDDKFSPFDIQNKIHQYLLGVNVEYASKVASKRLMPIEVLLLKTQTSKKYRDHCLKSGQRESQFKFLHLQYVKDVVFPFDQYLKGENGNGK